MSVIPLDEVRVTVNATLEFGENYEMSVAYTIRPREHAIILKDGLLNECDMPSDWYEASGFLRSDEERFMNAPMEDVLSVTWRITNLLFDVSRRKPILWVCGIPHLLFYLKVFRRMRDLRFTILRGSKKPGGNDYSPFSRDWGETGGSDDEHIVMLETI